MQHQIFLSYCRRDQSVADAFYSAASARNLTVWYDKLIPAGHDWRDSIVGAIEGSQILLILFLEESNKSRQRLSPRLIQYNATHSGWVERRCGASHHGVQVELGSAKTPGSAWTRLLDPNLPRA